MDLVAIALLCQVVGSHYSEPRADVNKEQLGCQKYYVTCWNKKREEQLKNKKPFDDEQFLSECVLERNS
jgi:hypothetical protein